MVTRALLVIASLCILSLAGCPSDGPSAPVESRAPAPSAKATVLNGASFESAYCGVSDVVIKDTLVSHSGALEPVELAVVIRIAPDLLVVDGMPTTTDAFAGLLAEKKEAAEAIAARAPAFPFKGEVLFSIDPQTPASRVAEIAESAAKAGFPHAAWVAENTAAPTPPAFLDPQAAQELQASALSMGPAKKQTQLAEAMRADTASCAPAVALTETVRAAAPAEKCGLLADGIDQILSECPDAGPRIVTRFQVLYHRDRALTAANTSWNVAAEPVVVTPAMTWMAVFPQLAKRNGGEVRLVVGD